MPNKGVQKVLKKHASSGFSGSGSFLPVQGALGRGFGRNFPEVIGAVRGVLEDPSDPPRDQSLWCFTATFPATG